MSTADVDESVLLVEPTDLLNDPLAPGPRRGEAAGWRAGGHQAQDCEQQRCACHDGRTHGGATRRQPSTTSMCSTPPVRRGRSGSATGATTVRKAATNEAAALSRWVTVSGPTCRAAAMPWHTGHPVHSAVPVPRCSLSNLVTRPALDGRQQPDGLLGSRPQQLAHGWRHRAGSGTKRTTRRPSRSRAPAAAQRRLALGITSRRRCPATVTISSSPLRARSTSSRRAGESTQQQTAGHQRSHKHQGQHRAGTADVQRAQRCRR